MGLLLGRSARRHRASPFVAGLFMLAIGGIFVVLGSVLLLRASAVASWPTVDGVIETSSIRSEMRTTGSGARRRSTLMHAAQVAYAYAVEGKPYHGASISPAGESWSSARTDAEATVALYPAGAKVPVRYDPDSPGRAYLEASVGWGPWLAIGLGGVAGLVGATLLLLRLSGRI